MKARYQQYQLQFKNPSGTSRGVLTTKDTWFIYIEHEGKTGVGECGMFRGLSVDDRPDFEDKLRYVCTHIDLGLEKLLIETTEFPSIQFALEQAFLSLNSEALFDLFPSKFTRGEDDISINGLVWMGDQAFMKQQIKDKIADGFSCIKMKIGAIDFATELELLQSIRAQFSKQDIELRVDANGAFNPTEALEKLKRLAVLDIHSIEQPIRVNQWEEMAYLCEHSPLPIALDEELIGVFDVTKKEELLHIIQPQYCIFKPTLIGGFKGTNEWISLLEKNGIGWWITSALESNVGLNAIAQYTYTLNNSLPQGLGTGSLFTNNIEAPLQVAQGKLHYTTHGNWDLNNLQI